MNTKSIPNDIFVGNILGALTRAVSDKIDNSVTSATGLSTSACFAIVQIGTEPGSSIEELRRMLDLEHSSVVRLIDRLESAGHVVRSKDERRDRRLVRINLTDSGERQFSKILDARAAVLARALNMLDDTEKSVLRSLIAKLMPAVVEAGDDQHIVCRLCDLEACPQCDCPVNLSHVGYEEFPESDFRRKQDSRFA